MSQRYFVCYPKEYKTQDRNGREETATKFVRVGVGFEMKREEGGVSLEFDVPLMLRAGARLVLFLDDGKSTQAQDSQPPARGKGGRR